MNQPTFLGENSNIELNITQTENNIVGELSGDYSADFKATIDSDTTTFKWQLEEKLYSDRWVKGEWKISEGSNLLPGTWNPDIRSPAGENWNLIIKGNSTKYTSIASTSGSQRLSTDIRRHSPLRLLLCS